MPFLRDEGPPIPAATIQKLRESLPTEYGWQLVNETGREVLAVRVPKAKPDYLHDLGEVAFYVGLETVRSTKDVLLIGHEKTARLEPQLLRDHIRAQAREDATVVDHLRRSLDRQYGHTFVTSPSNHQHSAFAVRIPKETVAQFTPDDVTAIRQIVASLRPRVMGCQYAYVLANADHERLGRRVLLELIGDAEVAAAPAPAPAPTPAPPTTVAAPIVPAPEPVAPAPAARTPFPSAVPSSAAPAHAASAAAALPAGVPPVPRAAPAIAPTPAAPPPALAADVTDHEEYTIVARKPTAAPSPPAAAPPAAPAPAAAAVEAHEEYEIVSKPKPAAPAPAPAPAPAAAHDEPERTVVHADKEFEVFVSKPKPKADAPPAITPPGKGGFMAAINSGAGPAPAKTKEYEIIGRTSVTSDPSIASRLKLPGASPTAAPSPFAPAAPAPPPPMQAAPLPLPPPPPTVAPLPPRVAVTPTLPTADNGAPIVARIAPAAPELVLAQRFRDAGYEVVEGLRAQGTVFAFAAHKPNGRRVLVKRAPAFAAEEAASLAQLVAALGADVALVVADDVKPGTRLATWGTRIEVVTPADVPALSF